MKTLLVVEWPDRSECSQTLRLAASGSEFVLHEAWDDVDTLSMRTRKATPADLAEALFGEGAAEDLERVAGWADHIPDSFGDDRECARRMADAARRVRGSSPQPVQHIDAFLAGAGRRES